jgi:thiamine-monophosphate kinase
MKLCETGEFGLIGLLSELIEKRQVNNSQARKNMAAGIGDDAAAWVNSRRMTLATTDCLVQDVHFRMGQTSWRDLGWKALAVNLSDIAAMGGVPEYALITLGLSENTRVEDVVELYEGVIELANRHGVAIAGGDTTNSATAFISLTVTGSAESNLLRRSGARPGDLIALTGHTGMSSAGRHLIESKASGSENDLPLRQAFLRPVPRVEEGRLILEAGGRAAIDISDGLAADLGHVCRASKVGAVVRTADVPIHPSLKKAFPDRAMDLALGGGEDYELLFTAPNETIEKVKARSKVPITVIGEITSTHPGAVSLLDAQGNDYPLKKSGWDHFADA